MLTYLAASLLSVYLAAQLLSVGERSAGMCAGNVPPLNPELHKARSATDGMRDGAWRRRGGRGRE